MQPSRYSPPAPKPPTYSMGGASPRFQSDRYYRHSGKAPLSGLVVMTGIGAITAIAGAALDILARVYIPYDIINILCCLGFGALIGALMGQAAVWGRVRNPHAAGALGGLAGALGLYAAWVFYLFHVTDGAVLLMPQDILAVMREIAREGIWEIRDIRPKGIWLYLIWLAEAACILGMGAVLAWQRIRGIPFCERTGTWLKDVVRVGPFEPPVEGDLLRRALEGGDYSPLKALRPLALTSPEVYAEIQLRASTLLHLLSVTVITVKIVNGQTTKKDKPLVNNLIVDAAAWEMARALQPGYSPAGAPSLPPAAPPKS